MKLSPRFFPIIVILGLLISARCETASADTTRPKPLQTGYEYMVHNGDTVEEIAQAYRDQGVDVTAKQILVANPNVKITTVFRNGFRCHVPETGVKLFIPAQIKSEDVARASIAPRLIEPLGFANFTCPSNHIVRLI